MFLISGSIIYFSLRCRRKVGVIDPIVYLCLQILSQRHGNTQLLLEMPRHPRLSMLRFRRFGVNVLVCH